MRLIDADAIPYKKIMFDDDEDDFYYGVTQPYIDRMPTIDAVPVVRCWECEMANPCSDEREMYCALYHVYKRKNYYCADGRREGR